MTEKRSLDDIYKEVNSAAPAKRSLDDIYKEVSSTPKAEPSFTQNVGEDFAKRSSTGIGEKLAKGDISAPSAALQTVEQGGGFIGDVATDVGKKALEYNPEALALKYAAGTDTGKAGIAKAKEAGQYVANTGLGKAVTDKAKQVKQTWEDFSKKHPEAAADIGGLHNLANLVPGYLAGEKAVSTALSAGEKVAPEMVKAGEAATKAGVEDIAATKAKKLNALVSKRETMKVAEKNVADTEQKGLLRTNVHTPDAFAQDVANTVGQVPGINTNRSFQYNYNKIAAENKAEAIKLDRMLKDSNVVIPPEKINQAITRVKSSLAKQTFLVGDAEKVADKMFTEAGSLLDKNGNTASGLLKTRQEFDKWARGQIAGDPFSDSNRARGASLKAIRDSLNNIIAEAVPEAKVKESLRKQFHLFEALDNIEPKAAREGKNIITRGIETAEGTLPTKSPFLKRTAGIAAAVPKGLYAAGQYVAPRAKIGIGKGLTSMGEALGGVKPKLLPEVPKHVPLALPAPKPEYRPIAPSGERMVPEYKKAPLITPAPPKPKALMSPEQAAKLDPVKTVDRQGNVYTRTPAEKQAAETAKAKGLATGLTPDVKASNVRNEISRSYDQAGLTPDVRASQIRNEVNKAYEQLKLQRNAVKEEQIAKIAEQSAVPVAQLVEMSDKSIKELAAVLGKEHSDTAFAQALRKAIREKSTSQ